MSTWGITFYVLTFPDDDLTWAYDTQTGRVAGWHERMYLNGSNEEAHRGRCCAYVGGEEGRAAAHLVGDRANGKDLRPFDGRVRRRWRSHRGASGEPSTSAMRWSKSFIKRLELDVEHGVGDVDYKLRWSNNGGKAFGPYVETTKDECFGYKPRVAHARLRPGPGIRG